MSTIFELRNESHHTLLARVRASRDLKRAPDVLTLGGAAELYGL